MKNQSTTQRMKWLVLGIAFAGGPAFAQEAMPQQPAQPQPQQPPQAQPGQQPMEMESPQQAEAPQISDEQLIQAAAAYLSVSEIQTRVQEELAGEEDQAVIQGAVMQARTDMIAAVQEAGMAPAQYEEIMTVVTQNEQIRNRFLEILQEHQIGG